MIFAGATLIQFLIGSYLEPRLSGTPWRSAISRGVRGVLCRAAVEIPGAFMGVPLAIAVLTILEQYPSTEWISKLLSGAPRHSV